MVTAETVLTLTKRSAQPNYLDKMLLRLLDRILPLNDFRMNNPGPIFYGALREAQRLNLIKQVKPTGKLRTRSNTKFAGLWTLTEAGRERAHAYLSELDAKIEAAKHGY